MWGDRNTPLIKTNTQNNAFPPIHCASGPVHRQALVYKDLIQCKPILHNPCKYELLQRMDKCTPWTCPFISCYPETVWLNPTTAEVIIMPKASRNCFSIVIQKCTKLFSPSMNTCADPTNMSSIAWSNWVNESWTTNSYKSLNWWFG